MKTNFILAFANNVLLSLYAENEDEAKAEAVAYGYGEPLRIIPAQTAATKWAIRGNQIHSQLIPPRQGELMTAD